MSKTAVLGAAATASASIPSREYRLSLSLSLSAPDPVPVRPLRPSIVRPSAFCCLNNLVSRRQSSTAFPAPSP